MDMNTTQIHDQVDTKNEREHVSKLGDSTDSSPIGLAQPRNSDVRLTVAKQADLLLSNELESPIPFY
jgi:hypothetical protein